MSEIFKDVPNFPGYQVSDLGRIRSKRKDGPGCFERESWRYLKLNKSHSDGYLRVMIYQSGKGKLRLVHRLVLEAFVGSPPEKCHASHLDGNRKNNCVSNLIWESLSDNNKRKTRHGTGNKGERHNLAKLTDNQVRAIRKEYTQGDTSHRKLAKKHGVAHQTIGRILRGKNWAHVQS